jgi:hypothetical protein
MIVDGELKEGFGCDDEAPLLFEGDRLVKAVAWSPKSRRLHCLPQTRHIIRSTRRCGRENPRQVHLDRFHAS